jgi:hypothetical protein
MDHELRVLVLKQFCDYCWWLHEVRCALGVMCDYKCEDASVEYHMYRIVLSMREYYALKVCALFDRAQSKINQNISNLTVEYLVEKIGFSDEVKTKLRNEIKLMLPFVQALRNVRNKIITHNDLEQVLKKDSILGEYQFVDELEFYNALKRFVVTADTAVNGVSGFEWPTWPREDATDFMEILQHAGCVKLDPQEDPIICISPS